MKREHRHINATQGSLIIEVLLASALFIMLSGAFAYTLIQGAESTNLAGNRARAVFLAEEGLEAVRTIRDENYANLTTGSKGLSISSGQWVLSGGSDQTDVFTRNIVISNVGSDKNKKKITSNIAWQQNPQRAGSVQLVTYLTNWHALETGWGSPSSEASLDLSGAQDGFKIQSLGNYVTIIRNSGSPDFIVVDVTTPASPSVVGSLSLATSPTNIFVLGNYAYITSASDTQELTIIDISTPSLPVVVGTLNLSGTADARGVYAVGSSVYVTRSSSSQDEFVIIDVTAPAVPTITGSVDLSGSGYEAWVSGVYAYVASGNNAQELQVVDISTPSSPSIVGSFNASGNTDAFTISGFGNTLLMGRAATILLLDVSTPSSPSQIASYAAAGTVNDIALNFGFSHTVAYFVTANSNAEFEAFDISVPSSPATLGALNVTALNGVAYSSSANRAYIVGEDDTAELRIIKPQ